MGSETVYWAYDTTIQYWLLFSGIALSTLMWWLSRYRLQNLLAISWRMYVTVVLTAGISPYFYMRPKFMLFWAVLIHGEHALKPSLSALVKAMILYWIDFMLVFLTLRFTWLVVYKNWPGLARSHKNE